MNAALAVGFFDSGDAGAADGAVQGAKGSARQVDRRLDGLFVGDVGLGEACVCAKGGGRSAQAAQVLRISPDKLDVEMPLTSLGMDSLMGLELRNRLETVLGINVPATLLWSYPTVAALGNHLAGTTQLAPREDSSLAPMDVSDSSEVEDMSQDDLARMITEKFEALK